MAEAAKEEVVEWTDSEGEDGQIVCTGCGGWRPKKGACVRCDRKRKRRKKSLEIGGANKAERKRNARVQLDELLRRLDKGGQGATAEEIRRAVDLAREGLLG